MYSVIILFLTTFLLSWIFIRVKNRKLYALASQLTGLPDLPLLGSSYLFIGKSPSKVLEKLHSYLLPASCNRLKSFPCRLWMGPQLWIIFDDPDHIQTILNSPECLNKATFYAFFDFPGLGTHSVNIWRPHRKALNPLFNTKYLEPLMPIYNDVCNKLVNCLSKKTEGIEFNVYDQIAKFTLDTLLRTMMDLDEDVQNNPNCPYSTAAEFYFENVCKRITSLHLHPDFIFKRSKLYKECESLFEKLKAPGRKALQRKLDQSNNNQNEGEKFFIDRLIELGINTGSFSKKEVEDEIHMMIFGGYENTSLTIANTILLLAMYPEIQEKVVEEIKSLFPDKNSPIVYENLSKLRYMEMAIKDGMRLFSVAPILIRSTVSDVNIGGYEIPAGTNIFINTFGNHLSSKYWQTPEKFNPDHFLSENVENRHRYAYLPFSAGSRDCIGLRGSWIAMKCSLVYALRHFKFTTTLRQQDIKMKLSFAMRITQGHMVSIENRLY